MIAQVIFLTQNVSANTHPMSKTFFVTDITENKQHDQVIANQAL